jgi:hypothetical protein
MSKNLFKILRSPDPVEGTPSPGPTPDPQKSEGTPLEGPQPPPKPQASPAPPPAATIVLEGTKTERELALERSLKERETKINQLEDDNRKLKGLGTPAKTEPAPQKKSFLEGGTFFG